jgi:hypothetical protein
MCTEARERTLTRCLKHEASLHFSFPSICNQNAVIFHLLAMQNHMRAITVRKQLLKSVNLTLREGHRLRMSESMVLRRTVGARIRKLGRDTYLVYS